YYYLGSLIDAKRKSNLQQRHPLGQEQINMNTSNAFLLDRKIEVITADLPAVYSKFLYSISYRKCTLL
ncbi:MAG: hypothetical protein WBL49_05415, partial [Nitrososphaeraceae archaeon]